MILKVEQTGETVRRCLKDVDTSRPRREERRENLTQVRESSGKKSRQTRKSASKPAQSSRLGKEGLLAHCTPYIDFVARGGRITEDGGHAIFCLVRVSWLRINCSVSRYGSSLVGSTYGFGCAGEKESRRGRGVCAWDENTTAQAVVQPRRRTSTRSNGSHRLVDYGIPSAEPCDTPSHRATQLPATSAEPSWHDISRRLCAGALLGGFPSFLSGFFLHRVRFFCLEPTVVREVMQTHGVGSMPLIEPANRVAPTKFHGSGLANHQSTFVTRHCHAKDNHFIFRYTVL